MTSLYDELGVSPNADQAEIEKAGRAAAKKHHPDAGGDRNKFESAVKALTILRDPEKRAKYDRTGEADDSPESSRHQEAMALVSQTVFTLIQEPGRDLARFDVVGAAKRLLEGHVSKHDGSIRQTEAGMTRLEGAIKRLKRKDEAKGDILAATANGLLMDMRRGIEMAREKIATLQLALEMLDDYTYEVDPPPAPQAAYGSGGVLNESLFRKTGTDTIS